MLSTIWDDFYFFPYIGQHIEHTHIRIPALLGVYGYIVTNITVTVERALISIAVATTLVVLYSINGIGIRGPVSYTHLTLPTKA